VRRQARASPQIHRNDFGRPFQLDLGRREARLHRFVSKSVHLTTERRGRGGLKNIAWKFRQSIGQTITSHPNTSNDMLIKAIHSDLQSHFVDDQAAFRPARAQDSLHLAALLDFASRGLVLWLWSTMAAPGQSSIEIGRERIRTAKESPSHFSNWTTATIADEIAGAFAAYPLTDPYDAKDITELPEVYSPMLELEAEAVGSWYIMTLSVFPEFRNGGLGSAMLTRVEDMARDSSHKQLCVMVVSDNSAALRLYNRFGFREIGRRRFIPFPGSRDKGNWLLLAKAI
jgi:ribosomal protein S18 acetylase RimI-like enzyme